MHQPWTLDRGARATPDNSTRFSLWAPRLEQPSIRILNGPAAGDHPLRKTANGVFEATIAGAGDGTDYCILTDDGRALPDPVSRSQPEGVHGPSRVVDPSTFSWFDDTWRGLALEDFVIYELHVGTFTPE